MKFVDYLFCSILFCALFLPTNDFFVIQSIDITLKAVLFVFLAIINIFGRHKNQFILSKEIRTLSFAFIFITFFTEIIIKPLYFYESISNGFKSFYLGMPLFLGLTLLLFNLRINIKMIWNTLCLAILVSVVLSILSLFVNIPIYQYEDRFTQFSDSFGGGRIPNANASFGIIALIILMKYPNRWFSAHLFYKLAYIVSILSLIITFNRTYIGLLIIIYLILFIRDFSTKEIFKNLAIPALIITFTVYFYNTNEMVEKQVNERILYLFDDKIKSNDNLFQDNRDMIYEGVVNNIHEGYWMIGLPFTKPMFYMYLLKVNAQYTDTSFVNILLRFGFIPLIIFMIILFRMYKTSGMPLFKYVFIIFVLASLNIDSLYRHNTIFFLFVLYFISLVPQKKQNENTLLNQ